jgi:REP element-mobilizing transposase RayT
MSQRDRSIPLAYFITFTTYGTWLHGREAGSVDREHNRFGDVFLPSNSAREANERRKMDEPLFVLDSERRKVVLRTIEEVSAYRKWTLIAAHVRSNHVHIVVRANSDADKVMNDYKAYATRRLKEAGFDQNRKHLWTESGSQRFLWRSTDVVAAAKYVVEEQGEPMELVFAPEFLPTEPDA